MRKRTIQLAFRFPIGLAVLLIAGALCRSLGIGEVLAAEGGIFLMADQRSQWIATLEDGSAPEEARLQSLGHLQKRIKSDLVDALTKVLGEGSNTSSKLKTAALQVLSVASMTEYGRLREGKITESARRYYVNEESELRMQAIEYGISKKDPEAFDILEQDLEKPDDRKLFPLQAALGYLATKGRSRIFSKYLDDKNEEIRSLAIQLAPHEISRGRVMEILKDKAESLEMRRLAARSLAEDEDSNTKAGLQSLTQDGQESSELRSDVSKYLRKSLDKLHQKTK